MYKKLLLIGSLSALLVGCSDKTDDIEKDTEDTKTEEVSQAKIEDYKPILEATEGYKTKMTKSYLDKELLAYNIKLDTVMAHFKDLGFIPSEYSKVQEQDTGVYNIDYDLIGHGENGHGNIVIQAVDVDGELILKNFYTYYHLHMEDETDTLESLHKEFNPIVESFDSIFNKENSEEDTVINFKELTTYNSLTNIHHTKSGEFDLFVTSYKNVLEDGDVGLNIVIELMK